MINAQLDLEHYRADLVENAKLTGMARADAGVSSEWREDWDRAIEFLADQGWSFTVEDVRRIAGPPESPNAAGSRFSSAARRGVIKRVGYRPSTRLSLKGSVIAVWLGVNPGGGP